MAAITKVNRKRRSDHGTVQMTPRDLVILRWIGDQYAIRLDHLASLAGRESEADLKIEGELARPSVQRLYNRWLKAGWIEKRKLFAADPQWVWLTKAGLKDVGLEYAYRVPSIARLAHIYAVNAVRLAIEAKLKGQAHWCSDRQVNLERKERGSRHVVDAEVVYPDKQIKVAIEVELTQKTKKSLEAVLAELQREYTAVWYFIAEECYAPVAQVIEAQPSSKKTFAIYHLRDYGG